MKCIQTHSQVLDYYVIVILAFADQSFAICGGNIVSVSCVLRECIYVSFSVLLLTLLLVLFCPVLIIVVIV